MFKSSKKNPSIRANRREKAAEMAEYYVGLKPFMELNIKFVSQKEFPLQECNDECCDYFLVRYFTGNYEIIPRQFEGRLLEVYLGYRIRGIEAWAVLPSRFSSHVPVAKAEAFRGGRPTTLKHSFYDTLHP